MVKHRTFVILPSLLLLLILLPGVPASHEPAAAALFPPPALYKVLPDNAVLPEELENVTGASPDWWTGIQEEIRQSEYNVTWQEQTYLSDLPAAYQAPNRAHNLRTYFAPQGVRVIPRVFEGETLPWEWGLSLSGYGYASDLRPVDPATLLAEKNCVTYPHGDALTEWYANSKDGLEQSFTLHKPPAGTQDEQSTVVLDLALSGSLTAALTPAGDSVEFTTADGVRVLHYGELAAHDATGRQLPAHLELPAADTIRLVVDTTDASYPITVDPLTTTPSWSAEGEQEGAEFGFSVGTAGDVNGDGYSDVIIGAVEYDRGETNEGRVYVYLGSPTGLGSTPAWTAEGDQVEAYFGHAVGMAGDVNNDGYGDVIVGVLWYEDGEEKEGRALVYHGGPGGLADDPAWTDEGDQADALFGCSVGTAGDVNHDGFSDIIVGACLYNTTQDAAGAVFVYHGGVGGLSDDPDWTAGGDQLSMAFGTSVGTAGDVNGDGYSDVIIGAPYYGQDEEYVGQVSVFLGSPSGLDVDPAWLAEGNQNYGHFGWSVATAGDVNGDGYSDVVVGVPQYNIEGENEGRILVYYGSAGGLGVSAGWTAEGDQEWAYYGYSVKPAGDVNGDGYSDIVTTASLLDNGEVSVYFGGVGGLGPAPAWTAEGDQADALFGFSVGTAGDVNGDGYSDLIVGASSYDHGEEGEGRVFVYLGAAGNLGATPAWKAESDQSMDWFGIKLGTAGDVNGDGYSDVIIGALDYDNGESNEGRAFVYHGSVFGLSDEPAWIAEGDQLGARFGTSVGTAGDVNGDGYSDVIVGAANWDDDALIDAGRVYVYHGSLDGLDKKPAWTAEGTQPEAYLGIVAGTAGDVNGDGYGDVVVGASGYDGDEEDVGQVAVYYGSSLGLSASPAWVSEGDQAGAEYGWAAGTAGDVNGDGYSDVIIGAFAYDGGELYEGRAFVYSGSAGGLGVTPAWTAEGDLPEARFGNWVATAGDVNGDGYSDVIVSAPGYDNGEEIAGRAFVYPGSAGGLLADPVWTTQVEVGGSIYGSWAGTAGDVNGDGYSDVIIGGPDYSEGSYPIGHVSVYLGSAVGLDAEPIWTVKGDQHWSHFGWSVGTAGDVNGDGYSDVIVGEPTYDTDFVEVGKARVYYGNGVAGGLSVFPNWEVEGKQDAALYGDAVGTAGDVDGDGYSDVIVSAPYYDNGEVDEGIVYLYRGSANGLSLQTTWSAEGNQAGARFGGSIGIAGDVNGDGYSDVIIGAYRYDNGEEDEGRVFVYHGGVNGLGVDPAWMDEGDEAKIGLGYVVGTAGDVNGDGYSDVIVGVSDYRNDTARLGKAIVYHGSPDGLSAEPVWLVEGDQADSQFGTSVGTAGDVNGDGYSDVIVGAFFYDNGQNDEGMSFVYHGSPDGLNSDPAWTAELDVNNACFGTWVGTAGDVNGDGYSDVIITAPCYYNGDFLEEGRVFVYQGAAGGLSADPDWMVNSELDATCFGMSAGTAGDVNGDGYSDVILGGHWWYSGSVQPGGRVAVYHGSSGGLPLVPSWTAVGDRYTDHFGIAVSTAGDVNGDGYGDVIIGASYYTGSESGEGQARVYYGSHGGGLAMRPRQLRSDSSTPIAALGESDSRTSFQVSLIGRMPLGRDEVRLQWQAAPLGTPITGTDVLSGTGPWTDVLTKGVEITQTVAGLAPGTPYHWRVRLLYRPGNALGQAAGRWISIPWNGWNETDLRTNNQAPIADAGADRNVRVSALVVLDGHGCTDPDGDLPLDYHWTQTGGPAVTLSDPGSPAPTFTAPAEPAVLTFALAVTDTLGLSDSTPDEVTVTVWEYGGYLPVIGR